MDIILPAGHGTHYNSKDVDRRFRSLVMPYADVVQTTADFGIVITQRHAASDFALGYHFTYIDNPVRLQMRFDKPVVMLSYLLDGEISYLDKGIAGDTSVKSGRYHLCYENAAVHPLALGVGYLENFYISFSKSYLQNIDIVSAKTGAILDAFDGRRKEPLHTQFYKVTARIRRLIREITSYKGYHVNLYVQVRINELLLLYLLSVANEDYPVQPNFNEKPLMKEIDGYIVRNLDRPLTLPILAKRFGQTNAALNEQFRRCFGVTVNKYVHEIRMLRAKEMLTSDQYYTVEEIANMCGYSDAPNFSNAFKKRFSHNPGYYRMVGKTLREKSQVK